MLDFFTTIREIDSMILDMETEVKRYTSPDIQLGRADKLYEEFLQAQGAVKILRELKTRLETKDAMLFEQMASDMEKK